DLGDGAMVGACARSRVAAFSFHPVKTVAMGEGGMATTNDPVLAERMARGRSHGMVREPRDFRQPGMAFDAGGDANPWYYEMPEPGFNYRPSDLNCALGISQLAKLGRFVARRRALVERYDTLLAGHAPFVRPIARHPWSETAWHLYAVLIDFPALGIDRAWLMRELRERGIGTQVHYIPVHRQPYYRERYGDFPLPGADAYYDRTLSLPLFPAMTDDDVARVAETLLSLTVNRR
ncbi:MAG: DegT/DnrJ/EryC1/StrS family aminotransferase, partial [Rhodospirillales bacterium]|nr:DegT/DnrJ/EryC1/StrS family aminotransferase [Rhodospirillales bacterium]